MRGAIDRLQVLGEGLGAARDDGDLDGGLIPDGAALVHLGNREVEGVAKLVLERPDDLTAVFERLRMRDGELDGQFSDWHSAGPEWTRRREGLAGLL